MFEVNQRAWVGELGNRQQALGSQNAWTLDWGCWNVSLGKAGSRGCF